jgi:hypothetical protein
VNDDQNSLKGGERGPTLLKEKMMHFDHERIPERVVHARGVGAHGIFEAYGNATLYYDTQRLLRLELLHPARNQALLPFNLAYSFLALDHPKPLCF